MRHKFSVASAFLLLTSACYGFQQQPVTLLRSKRSSIRVVASRRQQQQQRFSTKEDGETLLPADTEPIPGEPAVAAMLAPLNGGRVLSLIAAQSAVGAIACGIAWAVRGSPLAALGPGFAFAPGRAATRVLALGAGATLPLLGYVWAEEALDLSSRFPQTLGAVANATKATCLIALGNERAPLKAGIAACCLALAAGVGEELLFRGVLQEEISSRVLGGQSSGLVLSSIIFGALHAVTPTYAVLAGVAGLYFGALYNLSGHCVLVPVVAHALYDAVALIRVHLQVTADPEQGTARDEGPAAAQQRTRAAQIELLAKMNRQGTEGSA